MSINGGKDTAKEVEANLSLGLSGLDKKVIILDEAHDMSDAAQEAFLVSTEYLPKGVYLFMCTTDSLNLKATLKSRAFTCTFSTLHRRRWYPSSPVMSVIEISGFRQKPPLSR